MLSTVSETFLAANTPYAYVAAIAVAAIALIVFAFVRGWMHAYLARIQGKPHGRVDSVVMGIAQTARAPFYWFLAAYLGLSMLALPQAATAVLNALLLAWALYFGVRVISAALEAVLFKTGGDESARAARALIATMIQWALWAIAIIVLLSTFGINTTSLVAGLGISGIAVAFALQNILADLFSSFAIYLDKPFKIGDFIAVGDQRGTVSRIGIKTTRLLSLQGEEIVIANRELTSARIQNFRKMRERRVTVNFKISSKTPREAIARLPENMRERLKNVANIRVERVHLTGFPDASSLSFELVYYVKSGDYRTYMDAQQEVTLALLALFEREQIALV